MLLRPLQWWAESAPYGGDRVKVSENVGATTVAPVAPMDTSLYNFGRRPRRPYFMAQKKAFNSVRWVE